MQLPDMMTIAALRAAYAAGATPLAVIEEVIARRDALTDRAVFISETPAESLRAEAKRLAERGPEGLPLYGIPFAVKDNIDVAGLLTTAACPAFGTSPARDATTVARLRAAGAIVIGKTNLDQFATGLNGTRSPFGAPRCVFDADYVSGGSSSGSAVAVASGLCAFSLGSDTAGSGRVPAMFNNLVGLKPSPGLVPNTGCVPACRSVDVITVFAGTVDEAAEVRRLIEGLDPADPFSREAQPVALPARPRIGVLTAAEREFYGNAEVAAAYDAACARAEALGATLVPFDYAPFRKAAALLYDGPWVAERLAAVEDFLATNADDFEPTVRKIIEGAKGRSAVEAFRGRYRLNELRQQVAPTWEAVDMLLLPTSPTRATVAEMLADPIRRNSQFGLYTNFANLLGYAAIAVPAGFGASGLPVGVQLVGPAFSDEALVPFAGAMHAAAACGMGRDRTAPVPAPAEPRLPEGWCTLAVVGAHLSGMPLNRELTGPGGRCLGTARTAPGYRLYALAGTVPAKPGMVLDPAFAGPGLALELWALSPAAFGAFVAAIPAPLGVGKVTLDDGRQVTGFLCEGHALAGAEEITGFGGWRAYCAAKAG
ncbi:allophanate hydrolase [Sinirhodobacter ferrireducens]|uniref:Allophanate hydrolase n=1 Tax=Paenirhodobacter ferrireducens TaxID=1215032 RepID=A0A443LJI7_9RHOB|nr:allophanate hydrolase [Sinirhodobacter ferrireducens]RWR49298.1 allophanate hydrolase [Sinirhodobacter ferrireducens]